MIFEVNPVNDCSDCVYWLFFVGVFIYLPLISFVIFFIADFISLLTKGKFRTKP